MRVRFALRLYDRWRRLIHEMGAFGIIGVINTVLDLAVFNLFAYVFGIPALVAKCLSVVVSATSSYFMNRHWTFRHRSRRELHREYLLFFAFNAIGLLIALAVLGLFLYVLHLDSPGWGNVANLIGLVLGTVFRFWSYRTFVFLKPPSDDATGADQLAGTPGR